jgi:thiamine biosynthesis lipoprotein
MMRRAQPWLGTLVDIAVADALPDALLQPAVTAAYAEVALVQRLMSFHDGASDVSRLNRAAVHEVVQVHPHTAAVLRLARQIASVSDGIFDIGCAPRLVEWACLPAPQSAQSDTRPRFEPGAQLFDFPGQSDSNAASVMVRKLAPGWIDLGGIAKGYAVDLAIDALHRGGVRSACVNAGGDLRVIGRDEWPVSVRDPREPSRSATVVQLRDLAMATSGGYFSSRQHQGRPVCALVDGRTGQPVTGGASVSVRAPRCVLADALTKIVAASGDVSHPALVAFGAIAFIL